MCRHKPMHGWTPRLSSKKPLTFEGPVSSIVEHPQRDGTRRAFVFGRHGKIAFKNLKVVPPVDAKAMTKLTNGDAKGR